MERLKNRGAFGTELRRVDTAYPLTPKQLSSLFPYVGLERQWPADQEAILIHPDSVVRTERVWRVAKSLESNDLQNVGLRIFTDYLFQYGVSQEVAEKGIVFYPSPAYYSIAKMIGARIRSELPSEQISSETIRSIIFATHTVLNYSTSEKERSRPELIIPFTVRIEKAALLPSTPIRRPR